MRLLLWVLLVTLVTLLASTAESSKIANADTPTSSNLESIQVPASPARALSPEYIVDDRRNLKVHGNDDGGDESYTGEDDEERAISVLSIFGKMMTSLQKAKQSISASLLKRLNKILEDKAMEMYKLGISPIAFQAANMGSGRRRATAFYKEWYDKNVAAGVIKALY